MGGVRFTAWLTRDERTALRKLAREHECSENFLVRHALRSLLFGKPIPEYLRKDHDANVQR